MAWNRRSSRFIIDSLRRYNPKITTSLEESASLSRSSISRISHFHQPNLLKRSCRPFVDGAKSFKPYCSSSSSNGILMGSKPRWRSQNPTAVIMLASGVFIIVYVLHMETVAYTNRAQFVVFTSSREKRRSQVWFEEIKSQYKGKIVENIRVEKIARDIVNAHKGLRKDPQSMIVLPHEFEEKETVMKKLRWLVVNFFNKIGKSESQTAHLEGFKWEVLVIDEPIVNAFCMPNGKMVVFTGLLDFFTEDAEIATIIAHEVGHAVARHLAEKCSTVSWMGIYRWMHYLFENLYVDKSDWANFLQIRIFSQRMEMEADYIGMLLMASAGYDPRVAPQVYGRLRNYGCNSKWEHQLPLLQEYLANHPCGASRTKLLSEAKFMEEAISIYTNKLLAEAN